MTALVQHGLRRPPADLDLTSLTSGPWPLAALGRVTTLWLAAAIVLSVATAGARTESDPANGGLWILLGMLSGLLAGTGSTFWLLAGFRSVRARQQATMARIACLLPEETLSGAESEAHTILLAGAFEPATAVLVRVPQGTLYHRSDCLMVAGKTQVPVAHADPSLEPCGVCAP